MSFCRAGKAGFQHFRVSQRPVSPVGDAAFVLVGASYPWQQLHHGEDHQTGGAGWKAKRPLVVHEGEWRPGINQVQARSVGLSSCEPSHRRVFPERRAAPLE